MTALALAALLCAPADESMIATLVEGAVMVSGAPLSAGNVLEAGQTVETQQGGRVEIAVPGGAVIRLGESSRLTLSAATPRKTFSARLLLGNLWARVHKLLASEKFEVETENGVAGVRGTEFRIEVAQDQPDLLRVYEGAVQVEGREGRWSHEIEAGNELRFRRDARPPRAFEAGTEKGNRFMDWVRSRRTKDGEEPGRIHRFDSRNPEREQRIRERIRKK
jgi:ferric-dicitrate binding protein FerR (iron transport regulator)